MTNQHLKQDCSSTNTTAPENRSKPQVSLSESEAIERAQNGEASAFEQLYNRYKRRVHAICSRLVSDPCEAEDLTQEAFLLVFRKIHTFRGASAFSTWLHRLALNVTYMHLRRKRLVSTSFEELGNSDDGHQMEVALGSPDVTLEGVADRMNLERALASLTTPSKTVFLLHDVHGFKHREIAEMLECSVESSKGQLHRARVRLRRVLRNSLRGMPCVFGANANGQHQFNPSAC